MKYMLLIYGEEAALSEEARQACYIKSTSLANDLAARGQFLAASPLQPVATATSVRMRGGQRVVTDGPFAETREQLGGYYLIEAQDLDQALDIAARVPAAEWGTIEVRPLIELAGLPVAG